MLDIINNAPVSKEHLNQEQGQGRWAQSLLLTWQNQKSVFGQKVCLGSPSAKCNGLKDILKACL